MRLRPISIKSICADVRWHYLLVAILFAVSTNFFVGDFNVRLANTSSDEGLVAASYIFKFPQNFAADPYSRNWIYSALTSMQNWLPAVSFRYLNMPPHLFAFFFVYLQNILLGLALFKYAHVLTRRLGVAWLSVCFVLGARPQFWNIACYGDLLWMPYALHLSLPFLVLSAALLLEGRFFKAWLALLVGSLFHPAQGLAACLVFVFYTLVMGKGKDFFDAIRKTAYFAVIPILVAIPGYLSLTHSGRITTPEWTAQVLANLHAAAWNRESARFYTESMRKEYFGEFMRNAILDGVTFLLSAVAVWRSKIDKRIVLFWAITVLSTVLLTAVHVLSEYYRIWFLFQLIMSRATILMVLFSLPLIALLLMTRWQTAGIGTRFVIAYFFIVSISVVTSYFMMFSLLPLCLADPELVRLESKTAKKCLCFLLGIAGYVIFLLSLLPGTRWWGSIGPGLQALLTGQPVLFSGKIVIWSAAVCIAGPVYRLYLLFVGKPQVLTDGYQPERRIIPPRTDSLIPSLALICLLLPSFFFILERHYQEGVRAITGEFESYYRAQMWAREHTKEDALFFLFETPVYGGWRNLAHRPFIVPYAFMPYYLMTKDNDQYNARVIAFYAERFHRPVTLKETRDLSSNLDESGLRDFSQKFGGQYVVKKVKSGKPLNFPVAYRNNDFVVYRLFE